MINRSEKRREINKIQQKRDKGDEYDEKGQIRAQRDWGNMRSYLQNKRKKKLCMKIIRRKTIFQNLISEMP